MPPLVLWDVTDGANTVEGSAAESTAGVYCWGIKIPMISKFLPQENCLKNLCVWPILELKVPELLHAASVATAGATA